ncbi:MAG: hypothetical protein NXY57DRAFT_969480 [Lentinula lateritia]|nr:MAG: hypothetical protein NXY57DRAFT_969480 [Lentinula lateritia]
MDLTAPIHRDLPRTHSIPYQTPVSILVRHNQHSPAYMRTSNHATSQMDAGPRQDHPSSPRSIHSSPHINSPLLHSTVPSLPSFPSVPNIPQSVSETWHHRIIPAFQNLTHNFTTPNMINYQRPLPSAPPHSSNTFIPDTYTPLGSPQFLPMNFIRSPVSVPNTVERTPSRILHQPRPHRIVDLDHLSSSAQIIPEIQSAPAVMSQFPQEHYPFHNHPDVPQHWIPSPSRAPIDGQYPMYYTPYPVYQNFQPPPEQPRSTTPKFKIEYSSIHATFLATIEDADSLKDRKSWVKWNEGVWQAVADGFVLGHICDEPSSGTPWTEWNTPIVRPNISIHPTRKEIEARLK